MKPRLRTAHPARHRPPPRRTSQPGQAARSRRPRPPRRQPRSTRHQPLSAPAPSAPAELPAAGVPAAAATPAPASAAGSGPDVEVLRRAWPEILQTLTKIKRSTWALVEPNAQVGHFEGQVLTLSFTTSGLAGAFGRADHAENLRQAIHKTIGIDCQITAVAGGSNSAASSEPNPKAPASREAPATSADVAWGLAPASDGAAPEAPSEAGNSAGSAGDRPAAGTAARAEAPAPQTARQQPAAQPATEPEAEPAAARDVTAPQSGPSAGPSGGPDPDASGSYSYPDDDWGPPRDEDAPPLDEEPPMDWDPSAPATARPASPAPSTSARTAPRTGSGKGAPGAAPAEPSSAVRSVPDPSADPWARAVEQSPGVWSVGTELNVGRHNSPDTEPLSAQRSPEPEPVHYEPAAAQIPEPVGAFRGGSGHAVSVERTPAPQLVPAVAGPAVITAAAAPVVATAPVGAPPASGRQSLYQRLSNSPEAEAGRAKAPARAVAAPSYEQDVPSADDETIEESGVFGRAAVERILGGKLLEERSLDGSPLAPRL